MKKFLAILVSAGMALSLAACGSGDGGSGTGVSTGSGTGTATETEAETKEEDKTASGDLIPITLQLKWVQQAQFMGYYAAKALGINPVHLGIVFTVNLSIGMFTPPFGMNIFVAQSVLGEPMSKISKALVPFILLYIAALLVITYVPAFSLALL